MKNYSYDFNNKRKLKIKGDKGKLHVHSVISTVKLPLIMDLSRKFLSH